MHPRILSFAIQAACGMAVLMSSYLTSASQTIWLAAGSGAVNYQGELRGYNLTFQGAHWLKGAGIMLSSQRRFDILLEYQQGMLSGADAENPRYLTRRRNLHFETHLDEVAVIGRIKLGQTYTSPFAPYLTAGLAAFRVNPYTFDEQGKKWLLFPLSTEGQGLTQYTASPAPRNFFLSMPLGAGIEIKLSRHFRVDVECVYRKCFTDRIDDVSGYYPDENILLSTKGFKAVGLSYRTDELAYESPYFPPEGTLRGNPSTKDAYYSVQLRFRYQLHAWSSPFERIRYLIRDDDWPYRF